MPLTTTPDALTVATGTAILNLLLQRHSAATLCMYDVRDLDGALMIDLVSTHPRVAVDGVWVSNPAYLPPRHISP